MSTNTSSTCASQGEGGKVFSKMEFAVQMTCASCVDSVKSKLSGVEGVCDVYVDLSDEVVLVETCLQSSRIQELLEETGKLVVFRGFGGVSAGGSTPCNHGAAVAALKGRGVGLVRLVQTSEEECLIEATIDGLSIEQHEIKIHEYGDLADGGDSCGGVYTGGSVDPSRHLAGEIGTFEPDHTGRISLQKTSKQLKVSDLIGRSVIVHETQAAGTTRRVLSGVIARSAGLFQNRKKLCTCDGVTIWDEARKSKTRDS